MAFRRAQAKLIAMMCVTLAVVAGCALPYDEFDSDDWKSAGRNLGWHNELRLSMVEDLRKNVLRKGMSVRTVRGLLGRQSCTWRYPDREAERQERYFLQHSQELFGMTRTEYIEMFGHPKDAPQAGFALEWLTGRHGSDCGSVYIRFLRGRVVEFG